jgi:hypothetical protein
MGHKYAIGSIDDATRRSKSYTMRHKSEAIDKWQQFLNEEILPKGRHVGVPSAISHQQVGCGRYCLDSS